MRAHASSCKKIAFYLAEETLKKNLHKKAYQMRKLLINVILYKFLERVSVKRISERDYHINNKEKEDIIC